MAFKSYGVYETAFDTKSCKSTAESGDLMDRIANHPILQLLHLKRRSKTSCFSPKKPSLSQSKSFIAEKPSEFSFQALKKETRKYFSSRANARTKANRHRLRPIGLSKSDDEILNRTSESPEEEDNYLDGYAEGSYARELVKDIHSLHVSTDKAAAAVPHPCIRSTAPSRCPSAQNYGAAERRHHSPFGCGTTSRPFGGSFAKLGTARVRPQKDVRHPRVKLLQGDLSKSQGLPAKPARAESAKLQSPPRTAPLPIKFYKTSSSSPHPNQSPSSWFVPVLTDELRATGGRAFLSDGHIAAEHQSSGGTSRSSINSLEVLDGGSRIDLPPPSVSVRFSSNDSVNSASAMSSMESLRSCMSDGNKSCVSNESAISSSMDSDTSLVNRPFLNLNHPHRSILQSAKFTILSPISDKSQEPFYDGAYAHGPDDGSWQKPAALLTPKNIPEDFRNIHHLLPGPSLDKKPGSDSGISTEDKQPAVVDESNTEFNDLPFDMPKLRRKLAAVKSSTLSNSVSSISSSIPNVDISAARRSLPPGGFSTINPLISRLKNHSDVSSSSASSDWEVRSSESSEGQGTPSRKGTLALQLGCTAMSIRGEPIDINIPLARQSWYHGGINRGEAENILRSRSEGSYLVRSINITRNEYSLALKSACGFMHLRLHFNCENGCYTIGRWDQHYSSVSHIIGHYSTFRIPIKGAEHMVLLYPVASEVL